MDFVHERFAELNGMLLDAVFLNPLMWRSKEGKCLFSEGILRTKRQVVYHIPFAGEDMMQMRKMAEHSFAARKETDRNTVLLMERGQEIWL